MGTQVLNTTVTSSGRAPTESISESFHIYAHCARPQSRHNGGATAGRIALAFVNIAETTTYSVRISGVHANMPRDEYVPLAHAQRLREVYSYT